MNAPTRASDIHRVRAERLHFAIMNGTHWVLLCSPDVLANRTNSVLKRSLLTCPNCYTIFAKQDKDNTETEVFKRMNDYGKPKK